MLEYYRVYSDSHGVAAGRTCMSYQKESFVKEPDAYRFTRSRMTSRPSVVSEDILVQVFNNKADSKPMNLRAGLSPRCF